MNEYYTPPADVVAGVRARSAKINELIAAADAGFDNIPADLAATIAALTSGSGVVVSADDTTIGYLDGKQLAGSNITFVVGSPGGNETLTISMTVLDAALNAADQVISRPKFLDVSETENPLGTLTGGTDNIDMELGNVVTATISTAEQTFTVTNPPATGSSGKIELTLTNAGDQTLNFMAGSVWKTSGQAAPAFKATGTSKIIMVTDDAGASWELYFCGGDL